MRRTKTIAIILPDALRSAGLQSLLSEYFPPVEIICFTSLDDFSQSAADCHYYIISADDFALNTDFFLPRRSKTLIITHRHAEATALNCLDAFAPQETIIEQLQQFFATEDQNPAQGKELSLREKDVLKLIAQGYANKEIADKLNISLNTVLTHRKNITARLGIKTVAGLTVYAIMNGLVSSDA
jgi:DNA-binding NarL/FixJ family response regulator